MECKANASDLLRSCVELCRGAAGWLQAAFRFYMKNIEFIILGLLFYIAGSQSYIKRVWSHWVYAAMFFGGTNPMADKEVALLMFCCLLVLCKVLLFRVIEQFLIVTEVRLIQRFTHPGIYVFWGDKHFSLWTFSMSIAFSGILLYCVPKGNDMQIMDQIQIIIATMWFSLQSPWNFIVFWKKTPLDS